MTGIKRQILIVTVIAAAIMELIDISIVNVALSHMSGNLGATIEDTSWVITSYAIANVIIIPITSFLTGIFGRRNYYIGSVILFTLCSLLCGQASGIWTLIIFRFLQGIGGGALLSVSQAIMFDLFPKEKQGIASALFGLGVFIGPTIGPTLGGFIVEHYSWPWIFFINIPVGIAVMISCYYLLKDTGPKPVVRRTDWPGLFLLIIGIGTLQTVLERGETEDWFDTPYIIVFTVVAIASLTLFIYRELTTPYPIVNLYVLKSRTLSVSAILTFISGIGMFTSVFITPVIAQRLLDFTPVATGMLLLPGAIIALFTLIISGRLLQKGLPPVYIIVTGFLLFIYFSWSMFRINLDVSAATISMNLVYRAVGIALLTVPLTMLAVSSLKPEDMAQGAALNNMMRQLGGSFGIAIINTFVARRTAAHRNVLIGDISAVNPLAVERLDKYSHYFQGHGFTQGEAYTKAMALMEHTVVKQSAFLSYRDAYWLVGCFFIVTLPLLLLTIKKRSGQRKPVVLIADH